jgi:hypothetical protein
MSEVYNPESSIYERLEALAVEARQLVHKRNEAASPEDRAVFERQLQEVETRVERLKRRLRG